MHNLPHTGTVHVFQALAEEATEIWGGHLGNFKIFLLQKLNSYGEP